MGETPQPWPFDWQNKAERLIKAHEGTLYKTYRDSLGIPTIGTGFNLHRYDAERRISALGLNYKSVLYGWAQLSPAQAEQLLQGDLQDTFDDMPHVFAAWGSLRDEAKIALSDMRFNIGPAGIRDFKQLIIALNQNPPDYEDAMTAMLDSRWAHQVKQRAAEDADLMLSCAHAPKQATTTTAT